MHPNFALDFRNDQITVSYSQEGDWIQVGSVAIDDPDLDAELGFMRSTAMGLAPRGIASKLILPNQAILYTRLDDLSPDPERRAAQIAAGLVGRTPYDVADLVFDWKDDGATAHVAVIARETLDEAEAFAKQHCFNPVSFVAVPEQAGFHGEVNFGPSSTAQTITPPTASAAPQADAAALSASDFEMGEAAKDNFAAEQTGAWSLDQAGADDSLSQSNASAVLTSFENGDEPDPTHDEDAIDLPDTAIPVEAPADDLPQSTSVEANEIAPEENEIAFEENDIVPKEIADIAPNEPADPEPSGQSELVEPPPAPQAVLQPDLFPPDPILAVVEEAPMALDVPMDETELDETKPISGPSAGKAQTLMAEFAARRAAVLGKADGAGRVEPVLTAAKISAPPMLAGVSDTQAENAPKIILATPLNPARASDTSLGSKPAVKRPAPTSGRKNSVLMGFVLTILLLIALAAAAVLSKYLATAWNSYGASTSVATVQPSIADEVAADLPDSVATSSPVPQDVGPVVPTPLAEPVTLPAPSLALAAETQSSLTPLSTPTTLAQPVAAYPPDVKTTPASPLIVPTAEGILTPEGVFLIAGQPSVLPLARPASLTTKSPALLESASAALANPALAGKKPLMRPDGLAPPPAVDINNDPALAGKKPLARPASVLAAGKAAQIASASLAQLDGPRSAMAVTISRLPAPRPKGLNTTTDAPQEVAVPNTQTPEEVLPEATANNAPLEADNEPEVVATKSLGPRTVVSKNATYKNAINLSKVNLIGVFGGQANRYALIRQSNGRFKKVYVGDRFDGGVVAAITDTELRYSKGGQMLALKMPKG